MPDSSRARPKAPSARNRLCSAMPSSMCWPAVDSFHATACDALSTRAGLDARHVDALAVDPAREVRGHRHVGGERDDAVADGQAAEPAERAAEGLLARALRRIATRRGDRESRAARRRAAGGAKTRAPARSARPRALAGGKAAPTRRPARSRAGRAARRAGAAVRSAPWFIGSAASGKPQPLIVSARITHGPVPVPLRLRRRPRDGGEVVAAHVADQRVQGLVGACRRGSRSSAASVSPSRAVTSALRTAPAGRRRSAWYSAFDRPSSRARRRSPPGRAKSARSREPQRSSMTCQPAAREPRAELARAARRGRRGRGSGDSCPRSRAGCRARRSELLEERLPHVALVELGVADHGDEAPRAAAAPP